MTTDDATKNRPPDASADGDFSTGCFSPELRAYLKARKAPPPRRAINGRFITADDYMELWDEKDKPTPEQKTEAAAADYMWPPDEKDKPTPPDKKDKPTPANKADKADKAEAAANSISPLFGCLALLAFIALGGAVFLLSYHATKQETKKEEEAETGFVPLPDDGSGTFILPLGKSGFAPAAGVVSPKAGAASSGAAASPSRPANVTARGGSFSGMGTGS